jgi:transposase
MICSPPVPSGRPRLFCLSRKAANKDRLPLEQTTEVVGYALSSHMPVYYRTFPGNMPDSRSLETILTDLDHAGFKDLVLVTDRGYDTR